jgi:hypothetical protein
MSTTLAALVALLQSEVPAVDGVPTTAQYEQAVKDAVMEFSHQCGLTTIATLSVVSGTATYSLPPNFLKLIMLESFASADGVIISATGLIPVSADWEEEYTIVNKQITFFPTPTYSLGRDYKYKAGWAMTGTAGSETYATLGEDEARIVLLKAKAIAVTKQNNATGGSPLKYSLGAVSVDNSAYVQSNASWADSLEKEFLAACDKYNGQVAMYG